MMNAIRLARGVAAVAAVARAAPAAQQQPAPAPLPLRASDRGQTGRGRGGWPIDVPLLAGAVRYRGPPGPGLRTGFDLRLFDAPGEDRVPARREAAERPAWRPAAILAGRGRRDGDRQKTSGFEADLGERSTIDRLPHRRADAAVPEARPARRQRRPRALDAARRGRHALRSAGRSAAQTELAFTAGSVPLPARHLGRHATAAACRRRRVPRRAESRSVVPPPPLTAPLAFERRPSEPGRSRFRVRCRRPSADRRARSRRRRRPRAARRRRSTRRGCPARRRCRLLLGAGTLRGVVQGDGSPRRRCACRFGRRSNRSSISSWTMADNPPLDLRGVHAVFAELPWIYFECAGDAR